MLRWLTQAPILIVTFAASFGVVSYRSHHKPNNSPITFECDGVVTAFRTHYHSSDGQHLRYGCYEHSSTAEAERYFQDEIRPNYHYVRWPDGHQTEVQIVQRTVIYDDVGNKTGERAVLDDGAIYWTDGPRYHLIYAPSEDYALRFEQSRAWAWEGCWKIPPRRKLSDCRTVPNKSLNRSGGTDLRIICDPT